MPTAVIGGIGLGLSAIGLGANIIGQSQENQSQQRAYAINKEQAALDAAYVRDITKEEVRKFRRAADKFQSAQKSAIGASGLRMSGSALQLLQETEVEIARDIASIEKAGEHKAAGIEAQFPEVDPGQYSALLRGAGGWDPLRPGARFTSGPR